MWSRSSAVSLPERNIARALAAGLLVLAMAVAPAARCAEAGKLPARATVHDVVKTLQQDPDLAGVERTRTLRWKKSTDPAPAKSGNSWILQLLRWIGNAMSVVAEGARWLMWLLGALLVAVLIVTLRRWVGPGGIATGLSGPLGLPSQVGALDVRPESLPARIGAAARDLWLQGQRRAALSLLYRGALSRLIHNYAVPIRAAHTEAECLGLAQRRLAPDQRGFFIELVRVWQRAVYGAHDPDADRVLALCADFDRLLDPPGAPGAAA
jgi:hypothetical protein